MRVNLAERHKERVMVTLMMRSDPFFTGYAADAPAAETLPEARAIAVREPTPVGIVVTANHHLSPTLPALSARRRAQRRKRLRAAFAAAVEYAIAHQARLFVQAGDLFDTPSPTNQDRAFVATALARLRHAGIPCVAIGGEHDLPAAGRGHESGSPLRLYAALEALHYFGATDVLRPRCYELGGLRLAVAGLSYDPTLPSGSDPLAGVRLDDEEGALVRADVGLLALHTAVAGVPGADGASRVVAPSGLLALPEKLRIVLAGQPHQYAHKRLGERQIVSCGATERMAFDAAEGEPGFVWLELGKRGILRAEHIAVEPQPRMEMALSVARFWSAGPSGIPADEDAGELAPPAADAMPAPSAVRPEPVPAHLLRLALGEVCTEETMVRLRLCGRLTREQFRQLGLSEILAYGRRHAFSFELDTSELVVGVPTCLGQPDATPAAPLVDGAREVEATPRAIPPSADREGEETP